jgi:hypothetical protein
MDDNSLTVSQLSDLVLDDAKKIGKCLGPGLLLPSLSELLKIPKNSLLWLVPFVSEIRRFTDSSTPVSIKNNPSLLPSSSSTFVPQSSTQVNSQIESNFTIPLVPLSKTDNNICDGVVKN